MRDYSADIAILLVILLRTLSGQRLSVYRMSTNEEVDLPVVEA